jgi:hypothetical protein
VKANQWSARRDFKKFFRNVAIEIGIRARVNSMQTWKFEKYMLFTISQSVSSAFDVIKNFTIENFKKG